MEQTPRDSIEPIDPERLLRLKRKATFDAVPDKLIEADINFSKLVQEETIQRIATYLDGWIVAEGKRCCNERIRKLQLDLRARAAEILR